MKRFFLAILFLSSFGFVSTTFAYNPVIPFELPYVTQGYTFDKLACASQIFNEVVYDTCVYVADDSSLQLRNNYLDYLEWQVVPNNSYYHYIVCQTDGGVMRAEQCATIVFGYGNTSSAMQSSGNALYSVDIFNQYPPYNTELLYPANYGANPPANDTLSITIDPVDGGTVEVDEVPCTTCPCIYTLSEMDQSIIHATANTGYIFGYWKETINPYPITPSGNKTMTAKFFRTFRNAVGSFRQAEYATGGQCVVYVRNETDILESCTGYAVNCFAQAKKAGYQTGNTPVVGSIIVFAANDSMEAGHVGIVTNTDNAPDIMIRDSNWCAPCETIHEHPVNINNYEILGYIYPTP